MRVKRNALLAAIEYAEVIRDCGHECGNLNDVALATSFCTKARKAMESIDDEILFSPDASDLIEILSGIDGTMIDASYEDTGWPASWLDHLEFSAAAHAALTTVMRRTIGLHKHHEIRKGNNPAFGTRDEEQRVCARIIELQASGETERGIVTVLRREGFTNRRGHPIVLNTIRSVLRRNAALPISVTEVA